LKQKYDITISPDTGKLTIQEYAELEKGEFAFVCEEIYEIDEFKNAMDGGVEELVTIVRRPNMYPRQDYGERIAQEIIDLLNDTTGATSGKVLINDRDDFIQEKEDVDPRVVYEDDDKPDKDDAKDEK
jgi:hypothetical protein